MRLTATGVDLLAPFGVADLVTLTVDPIPGLHGEDGCLSLAHRRKAMGATLALRVNGLQD